MRLGFSLIIKAVSALVAGMAFFFLSCAPRPVVVEPPQPEVATVDYFMEAEAAYEEGNYEDALQGYRRYLHAEPEGENVAASLLRIAGIDYSDTRYKEALAGFQRVTDEFPGHPESAFIRHSIAVSYFRLNEFQKSNREALEWLNTYPEHSLKGEIYFLIGRNFQALGHIPNCFQWWLKAEGSKSEGYSLGDEGEDISDKIESLIDTASIDDLHIMAAYAEENYLPAIYYRTALTSLKNENIQGAKQYAMALIRTTSEQRWVSKGREILEKVFEIRRKDIETAVKKGVIGCLLPLTGDFASYGQELLNGIQLGMDLYTGGTEERALELVIRDTAGNSEKAVSGVEDLVNNEKVIAIIGPLTSKSAAAAAKKAQEMGVPIITLTQKSGITEEGDMVFRNFLTPEKEVESLLDEAIEKMGLVRFGVLYPENSYGRFFMNLFWDRVEDMGGRITAIESYDPADTDYAVQIKKMTGLHYTRPESVIQMLEKIKEIKSKEEVDEEILSLDEEIEGENDSEEKVAEEEEPGPIIDFDAVFIPDNYRRIALIAPQFPFYNVFNIPFLGTSLWRSPELIETTGDYVQNAIFPTGFFSDGSSQETQDFVNDYKTVFSTDPGILAASGYDTVRFIKGLTEKNDMKTRDDFREGISKYYLPDGVTGKISFGENGEVEKEPVLLTVFGKKIQQVPEHGEDYYRSF